MRAVPGPLRRSRRLLEVQAVRQFVQFRVGCCEGGQEPDGPSRHVEQNPVFEGPAFHSGAVVGDEHAVIDAQRRRRGIDTGDTVLVVDVLARIERRSQPDVAIAEIRSVAALGDALATAKIFTSLIPMLRQQGIRTFAEAAAACRKINEMEARGAGGLMAVEGPAGPDRTQMLSRIDSYPYRHRIRDVMSAPPVVADAQDKVADVIAILADRKISSVFVKYDDKIRGIVTERDVIRLLHEKGELVNPMYIRKSNFLKADLNDYVPGIDFDYE